MPKCTSTKDCGHFYMKQTLPGSGVRLPSPGAARHVLPNMSLAKLTVSDGISVKRITVTLRPSALLMTSKRATGLALLGDLRGHVANHRERPRG